MILSILKLVVAIVVGVVGVIFFCIQKLVQVVSDGAAQAKDATPGVIEALKIEASITADKLPTIADKFEGDLRKVFRVPTRTKEEEVVAAN